MVGGGRGGRWGGPRPGEDTEAAGVDVAAETDAIARCAEGPDTPVVLVLADAELTSRKKVLLGRLQGRPKADVHLQVLSSSDPRSVRRAPGTAGTRPARRALHVAQKLPL